MIMKNPLLPLFFTRVHISKIKGPNHAVLQVKKKISVDRKWIAKIIFYPSKLPARQICLYIFFHFYNWPIDHVWFGPKLSSFQ